MLPILTVMAQRFWAATLGSGRPVSGATFTGRTRLGFGLRRGFTVVVEAGSVLLTGDGVDFS